MEAIILAGGFGTRLKGVIGEIPKCMATVCGKPFLYYLLKYLAKQNCTKLTLSLGYKSEIVTEWLLNQNFGYLIDYVIEQAPLGTGGGIQLALKKAKENNIVVINGDTFFDVDLITFMLFHTKKNAEISLALNKMIDFDRYGIVNTDEESNSILEFEEKKYQKEGFINGGVYIINKEKFLLRNLPSVFSFEKEYLQKYAAENNFFGYKTKNYFIDIGIPEDYNKAQTDFKYM